MGVRLRGQTDKGGRGLVFVVSAPSGAGKTTLVRKVMAEVPGLRFSVSYTTRLPRSNERDGEDYHFVSPTMFQRMVEDGQFLEWAEVLGNRYGTLLMDIKGLKSEGVDLILDIDTQGAKKL
jgi:guanylate kinase